MTAKVDLFLPPLPENILLSNNFFDLYPFDGGGCFINRDIAGSGEDDVIARKILRENALKDYGGIENIDFLKYERWQTIEKSCWINRMYFIVPLARQYRLTGDESLAQLLKRIILRFAEQYPAPETKEKIIELETRVQYSKEHDYNSRGSDFDGPADYQWFDFQPASRIIHLLHALWFLHGSSAWGEADKSAVDELIRSHARIIYWAEAFHNPLKPDNHQALRGLALLYAAAAFKDEPEAAAWAETALRICHYHIATDFLQDGMLQDMSPSYHFFETWISRDVLLLCDREHFPMAEEARAGIRRAFEVCRLLAQPDGLSTVVCDGYPLDMAVFLRTLPHAEYGGNGYDLLDKAQMALYRKNGTYFFFDCSPLLNEFSHYHGGKMAPTVFFGGKPFLTDSGCCSYDHPAFAAWFKQCEAHSSLLINGIGDSLLDGKYHWLAAPSVTLGAWRDNLISAEESSPVPGWENTRWRRTVSVNAKSLVLSDEITRPDTAEYTFVYILHPDVEVALSGNTAVLTNGGIRVQMTASAALELADGTVCPDFAIVPSHRLLVRFNCNNLQTETRFELLP